MPPKRKRETNAERKDKSHNALLDAGAGLIVKAMQDEPYAAIRIRDICEEAGYSTGAFYVHWDTVDDYYDALSRYLLAAEDEAYGADFARIREGAERVSLDDPVAAMFQVANDDFRSLLDSDIWDAMELFQVTWGRTRYQPDSAAGYRRIDEMTAEAYWALLERLGRESRPPFDPEHTGILLQALVEGLGLRHRIEAAAVEEVPDDHGLQSLYSLGAAAMLSVMTRRVDDRRDAFELLEEQFSRKPALSPKA